MWSDYITKSTLITFDLNLFRLPLLQYIMFTEILKSYNPQLASRMAQWLQNESELHIYIKYFYEIFRHQLRDVDVRNGVIQKLMRDKVLEDTAISHILAAEDREAQVSRLIHNMSQ